MRLSHVLAASAAAALVCVPSWAAGFTITPTFSAAITNDANSAAIESTINSAIGVYQSLLTDPINVNITFDEMNTGLGSSTFYYGQLDYSTYLTLLTNDAVSASDATALAHLPVQANNPVNGTAKVYVKTANLRAIGVGGAFGPGGSDGIIGLNTALTTPGSPGSSGTYSLFSIVEHEINEILGLGSALDSSSTPTNPFVEDLFRYDASGNRSFTTDTSAEAFFSIDTITDLVKFNQSGVGDHADYATVSGVAPQVQDAFTTPGSSPALGSNEIIALDVIGYNVSTAPEPCAATVFAGGLCLLGNIVDYRSRSRRS